MSAARGSPVGPGRGPRMRERESRAPAPWLHGAAGTGPVRRGARSLFVIVVGRQVRQAADDLQLRLGQVLAWAAPASRPPWRRIRGFSSWIKLLAAGMSAARGSPLAWLRGRECGTRIASAGPWCMRGRRNVGPVPPRRAKPGFAARVPVVLAARGRECGTRIASAGPWLPRPAFTGARYRCGGIVRDAQRPIVCCDAEV